jgi:hypothetical protein
MPTLNNGIMKLRIKVTLTGTPDFDIAAGDKPSPLGFNCSGGQSLADQALLKEVLGKIIASYPHNPISLCIDGTGIVQGSLCAGGSAVAAPAAAAPKKAAPKKAAPKADSQRKAPKKPSSMLAGHRVQGIVVDESDMPLNSVVSTNGCRAPNAAMLQVLSEIEEIRKGMNPKKDQKDYVQEARAGAMYGFGDD